MRVCFLSSILEKCLLNFWLPFRLSNSLILLGLIHVELEKSILKRLNFTIHFALLFLRFPKAHQYLHSILIIIVLSQNNPLLSVSIRRVQDLKRSGSPRAPSFQEFIITFHDKQNRSAESHRKDPACIQRMPDPVKAEPF